MVGVPWPMVMSMGAHNDTSAPASFNSFQVVIIDPNAVDVFVARPHQPCLLQSR